MAYVNNCNDILGFCGSGLQARPSRNLEFRRVFSWQTTFSGGSWVAGSLETVGTVDFSTCISCVQHGVRVARLLGLWLMAPRQNVPRSQKRKLSVSPDLCMEASTASLSPSSMCQSRCSVTRVLGDRASPLLGARRVRELVAVLILSSTRVHRM